LIQKLTPYIYLLFFIVFSDGILSQNLTLKITSKDSLEKTVLSKVHFLKKHSLKKPLLREIDTVSNQLKQLGYFTNSIDSVSKKDSTYTAYFSLGIKIGKAVITLPYGFEIQNQKFKIQNKHLYCDIQDISFLLKLISNQLEKKGASFSKVSLKKIHLKGNILFAELDMYQSKKRIINKVIVRGYDKFPKSFIKHYLNIRKNTVFNQQKLIEISSSIKLLHFVSEIKPPEILFSKDSTSLYIYLKKEKRNTFDGLVSFTSKKNKKGALLNGHIDLKLNNILHSGENFELFWKSNGEEKQQFTISTEIPYIFNSAFTPTISFSLYKHDSTFLNTNFHSGISYNLNPKSHISLTYESEGSKNLLQNKENSNVKDFNNSFLGLQFSYRIPNKNNFNDSFYLKINPSFGNRITNNKKIPQFKIDFETAILWRLNYRNSIYIRNQTGYLHSADFLKNEIYRIGGTNSIRGFSEESIFTSQYSFLNLEYRYSTSLDSYFYTITDFGKIKTINSKQNTLTGLGLGYLFRVSNSQINLGYVLGKTSSEAFRFNKSKILIKIQSYF